MFALLNFNPLELIVVGGGFVLLALVVLGAIYLSTRGNSNSRPPDED